MSFKRYDYRIKPESWGWEPEYSPDDCINWFRILGDWSTCYTRWGAKRVARRHAKDRLKTYNRYNCRPIYLGRLP